CLGVKPFAHCLHDIVRGHAGRLIDDEETVHASNVETSSPIHPLVLSDPAVPRSCCPFQSTHRKRRSTPGFAGDDEAAGSAIAARNSLRSSVPAWSSSAAPHHRGRKRKPARAAGPVKPSPP